MYHIKTWKNLILIFYTENMYQKLISMCNLIELGEVLFLFEMLRC